MHSKILVNDQLYIRIQQIHIAALKTQNRG